MISNFSWIIIILILLIVKFGILQPLEDKRKYKERAKKMNNYLKISIK